MVCIYLSRTCDVINFSFNSVYWKLRNTNIFRCFSNLIDFRRFWTLSGYANFKSISRNVCGSITSAITLHTFYLTTTDRSGEVFSNVLLAIVKVSPAPGCNYIPKSSGSLCFARSPNLFLKIFPILFAINDNRFDFAQLVSFEWRNINYFPPEISWLRNEKSRFKHIFGSSIIWNDSPLTVSVCTYD